MKTLRYLLFAATAASALVLSPETASAASVSKDMETADPLAKKITGSEDYVPMFGIRASVSFGFTVSGVIQVDAGLHVVDSKVRKRIDAIRPRINDALRRAVTNYANGPYRDGQVPNLDVLRARMQRAMDKQVGAGNAQVMLASVIIISRE